MGKQIKNTFLYGYNPTDLRGTEVAETEGLWLHIQIT